MKWNKMLSVICAWSGKENNLHKLTAPTLFWVKHFVSFYFRTQQGPTNYRTCFQELLLCLLLSIFIWSHALSYDPSASKPSIHHPNTPIHSYSIIHFLSFHSSHYPTLNHFFSLSISSTHQPQFFSNLRPLSSPCFCVLNIEILRVVFSPSWIQHLLLSTCFIAPFYSFFFFFFFFFTPNFFFFFFFNFFF